MTEQTSINLVITEGLKKAAGCEVVKSNLAGAPLPPYPYISFTILKSETRKGTYGGAGTRQMPLAQTWSFTAQGDVDDETFAVAQAARDWLEEAGRDVLNDGGIVVQSVGPIQNRDTLLTVEYEYRKGFDALLWLVNRIDMQGQETIERFEFEKE